MLREVLLVLPATLNHSFKFIESATLTMRRVVLHHVLDRVRRNKFGHRGLLALLVIDNDMPTGRQADVLECLAE